MIVKVYKITKNKEGKFEVINNYTGQVLDIFDTYEQALDYEQKQIDKIIKTGKFFDYLQQELRRLDNNVQNNSITNKTE